ncbi:MAG TPA: multicopper oxidase domain-containing protein [Gemmatimonadales bacterium]|jgi:FtsP/CotA-like multicopper oxidase with cupredoxin domain|nr:multicopper oxidase domain-containing protein [Gemmatimonadales bacterium]
MHRLAVSLTALAGAASSFAPAHAPSRSNLPAITFNDNRRPAGRLAGGTLSVALEIRRGDWRPLGPDHPGVTVMAFAEAGRGLEVPGPLLRVPLGTAMRVRITNRLDTTMVLHGLAARHVSAMDSLILAPGETGEARFPADAEGTYYYWAGKAGTAFADRLGEDSQLNGALIVDPSGVKPPPDRIFLISQLIDAKDSTGAPDLNRELLAINGRPWPLTERLSYQVGDPVRWRVILAADNDHPMHLHGFYFRVEARGDIARDTIYWARQQRMGVTELLSTGRTMRIAWSPDRPGGWIFHCHLNFHIIANARFGAEALSPAQREQEVFSGHGSHDPKHLMETAMGGLILAIDVTPAPKAPLASSGERRRLRLFIQDNGATTDSLLRSGYVLQEGDREPARDSVRTPGSTIVLHRGEPTSIWVINRTPRPTAIHWHGLEVESPFDGVIGVGGFARQPTPPIMPGDSFEVRVTPPRSGSFMYHTHAHEVFEQTRGLWGPLLVLEPGGIWDPTRDLIFQMGWGPDFEPVLNGKKTHDPIELWTGASYRFRLMNITLANPALQFSLVKNGVPIRWTALARDGADLPAWQRSLSVARQPVGIGETHDMEVRFAAPGEYALEARSGAGELFARQAIRVVAP